MSEDIDLKEAVIPGLENALLDFISSYSNDGRRNDYGHEFLTEAANGLDIPVLKGYTLPKFATASPLQKVVAKRVRSSWRKQKKPWSIKALDELREGEPCDVDLLGPKNYDGTMQTSERVTYSLASLPNLAYIYTSLLVGGSASVKITGGHVVTLHVSDLLEQICVKDRLKGLEKRIGPALCKRTRNEEEISINKKGEINIRAPYSRLMLMMGLPTGMINGKQYDELGLNFLDNLLEWVENDRLGDTDRAHAVDTIKHVNDAFVEHRLRLDFNTYKRASLQIPTAKSKETAEGLNNFFSRVWRITNPDIPVNIRLNACGDHFQPSLGIPTEYLATFCERYATLLSK
jgi:hypothetical protein